MSAILSVKGLTKHYPGFTLRDVSFDLREGAVTGFIGRNGAGKSTTLKCLLNLVHPDAGQISFFGMDFAAHELECKARLGFVPGAFGSYAQKKLSAVAAVTAPFYPGWDGEMYRRCLARFALDENKRVRELSAGMQVKFSLALALSHHAHLLLLDEPTSGLDPVSREELLDLFLELVREGGVSILFSTHITSDLDKCADDILYLKNGVLAGSGALKDFLGQYRAAHFDREPAPDLAARLLGLKRDKEGWSALVRAAEGGVPGAVLSPAGLETVMVHLDREASV